MNQLSYRNRFRANFRLIEAELYNYQESLKEIEETKKDIILSSASGEVQIRSGIGNPTQNKAFQVFQDEELMEQEKRCKAIAKAVQKTEQTHPEISRLIEDKYFKQIGNDKLICKNHHIAEATFYRWRRFFVSQVAAELGWRVKA